MITQYSRVQLTLSEKEKEYAWFSYAAKIIRAGCNDQQMSGYTVTGTGIDGQEIKAELTNEELFQLFSEITMKYGRKLVTQEMEQHSLDQESDELLKPDITDRPLERRDYQIQITRHELKTRKADVTITWGNNLKVEGLYVASRVRGGVRLSVPVYFVPGGGRMDLITVGQQLQAAVLRAYQQMEHEGKDQCRVSYLADRAAFQVVLVYKCRQKKLNSLYYKKKEQRRCSTWRKIKNRILRNSSSRSSISTMPEVPHILNWNMNMA